MGPSTVIQFRLLHAWRSCSACCPRKIATASQLQRSELGKKSYSCLHQFLSNNKLAIPLTSDRTARCWTYWASKSSIFSILSSVSVFLKSNKIEIKMRTILTLLMVTYTQPALCSLTLSISQTLDASILPGKKKIYKKIVSNNTQIPFSTFNSSHQHIYCMTMRLKTQICKRKEEEEDRGINYVIAKNKNTPSYQIWMVIAKILQQSNLKFLLLPPFFLYSTYSSAFHNSWKPQKWENNVSEDKKKTTTKYWRKQFLRFWMPFWYFIIQLLRKPNNILGKPDASLN